MEAVQRITPEISRLRLPLPLEGLDSVNCYVLRGRDETVLIDPGWSSPETDRALRDALAELEFSPTDISRILVTHHHWDHYTQAINWQRAYDIPVHLGIGESPNLDAWQSLDSAFPRQGPLLRKAGAAELATSVEAIPVEPHERAMDYDEPSAWIADHESFDLGGLTVRSIPTPGHTRGHVCFEIVERNMIVSGDHVLPRITPSIAFEREPDPESLAHYLTSLELLAEVPDAVMLPAHGAIGATTAYERATELIAHHDDRLEVVRDLVGRGRSTAFDIASSMPWTRHEKKLRDLELIHAMTAVLEVRAHLTVLQRAGAITARVESGVEHFLSA